MSWGQSGIANPKAFATAALNADQFAIANIMRDE